jgi:hypothetical protein
LKCAGQQRTLFLIGDFFDRSLPSVADAEVAFDAVAHGVLASLQDRELITGLSKEAETSAKLGGHAASKLQPRRVLQ